ncbi:hypothetical protein D3C79_939560 [compost metagenome]
MGPVGMPWEWAQPIADAERAPVRRLPISRNQHIDQRPPASRCLGLPKDTGNIERSLLDYGSAIIRQLKARPSV